MQKPVSERGHLSLSAPEGARANLGRVGNASLSGGIEHLDFGTRNPLVYFRDLKQATLDLSPGSGVTDAAVGRLLGAQRVGLSELFGSDPDALRAATKRVRSISDRARRGADKGSPGTLCVAWGMATWENERSSAVPAAPIVLRQASIALHVGAGDAFDVMVNGEWNLNTSLLRLLEVEFGIDVEREALLDLVDELDHRGDGDALFERFEKMAADVPGFAVAPRVVVATVPRVAMVVRRDLATPAMAPGGSDDTEVVAHGETVELVRTGVLDPGTLPDGSVGRRIVEKFAPEVIISDIANALRDDGWPEPLVEQADSGLRVRDRAELLWRWHAASPERPRPSGWDATHFALWGLVAAPPAGEPAIESVARWGERRHHPILVAWQVVAGHRTYGGRRRKVGRAARAAGAPKGMEEALWGLPVDLLVEWAAWVFRRWPGAPFEFVLPAGTPALVSAWYERARPVAELAVKTWVPFAQVDDALGKSARRWVRLLSGACGGGGAPLATWFERSMDVATEAVAVRLGDGAVGGFRGRRRDRALSHADHAI
jgi:hypothetical protein